MISDPLHRTLTLWGIATAAVAAALIHWVDIPIASFFYAQRETPWVAFFSAITDFANGVIWYSVALIGIIVAAVRHGKRARRPNPQRPRPRRPPRMPLPPHRPGQAASSPSANVPGRRAPACRAAASSAAPGTPACRTTRKRGAPRCRSRTRPPPGAEPPPGVAPS